MGGGPSVKRRHGGCGVASSKIAGTGSPAPPGDCFMQIPASETLLFFPHRRGKFWPDLEKQPNPHACDWVGVASAISVLSGEATLLHSSGVIPCACFELWWNYLA